MKKVDKSDAMHLRQKAKRLLKNRKSALDSQPTEANIRKLIHELEVHQIELELQNEELTLAKEQSDVATKKYIELYDFAPVGYFALSKEGKIVEMNLSGANILGKERSHLIDSLFGFFVSNDTRAIFNHFLGKVFISKIKETCEVTLLVHGQMPKYVQLSGIAAEEEEQCLVTMSDLTARKQAEEALVLSEARYRRLFETAKDGILILDAKTGKISDVNPYMLELLGYTEEQLIEKTIWEIGCLKDIVANREKFIELQHMKFVRYEDLPLEAADGRQINVEFVSNVYSVNHHKVIQCNIRDITERKIIQDALIASEENLKKVNATKDKFFSIIAHDLRSPFNGIVGFSSLLEKKAKHLDVSTIELYAGLINSSSHQVLSLLDNLLNWARMQHGQIPFKPSSIVLKKLVNEVIDLMIDNANLKDIHLFNRIPDDLIVHADENMIKTLIRNLVSNAIKFTSADGKVELFAVENDAKVEVAVKDNGQGMNSENLDRLFKMETMHSTQGTKDEGGTGMGLILCREFVEKHGGKIWAESEPDKGSVFKFSLPK